VITPGRTADVVLEDGTTLEYTPVHPALGVEVKGIDLAGGVSPAVAAELRKALAIHSLLLFPDQDLTPADELDLLRVYNDISDTDYEEDGSRGVPGYPQIVVLSNIVEPDGTPVGYANKKGMEWHTDGSGWQLPPVASSLYAIEVPATGGETHFVNGFTAFEMLPPQKQAEIEHMQCTYSYVTLSRWLREAAGRTDFLTEEEEAKYPDVVRPLVRTHPVTGRRALWFSIEEITQIDDLSYEASRELLLELIEHMTADAHVHYVHRWEEGQLIHWDNRSLMHSVSEYNYEGQRRLMHQITGKDLEFAV
jgi:taurine dioxygenase